MIKLNKVRLSFPSLFQKSSFNGVEGKYEATFIINKDDPSAAEIKNAIKDILKEKKAKLSADKICLKDGDEVGYEGYENSYSIKASSNKRVPLFDRDKSIITEEDEKLYAGCYVNAVIGLWYQDNNYGKRINANLIGVQFCEHGEAFGSNIDATSLFDDLENSSDDKVENLFD